MRKAQQIQPHLLETSLDLEHAKELKTISRLLDQHPTVNELVLQDLPTSRSAGGRRVGAEGMSAEQVLRALVLNQMECRINQDGVGAMVTAAALRRLSSDVAPFSLSAMG